MQKLQSNLIRPNRPDMYFSLLLSRYFYISWFKRCRSEREPTCSRVIALPLVVRSTTRIIFYQHRSTISSDVGHSGYYWQRKKSKPKKLQNSTMHVTIEISTDCQKNRSGRIVLATSKYRRVWWTAWLCRGFAILDYCIHYKVSRTWHILGWERNGHFPRGNSTK